MLNRRDFIRQTTTAGATAALLFNAAAFAPGRALANPDAPDPNDPNDPNAITDPDQEIGKPYRGWREGEFDIHFIHTGTSENAFHIYPDGTTALFDCGEQDLTHFGKVSWNSSKKDEAACKPKPDGSRRGSEWVARYIKRLLPDLETIDYVLASHFHSDHVGHPNVGVGKKGLADDKDYQISGISNVGESYRFGTAFDRAYPDYEKAPVKGTKGVEGNLRRFWDYAERERGLKREEFVVGALDQIKLVNKPEAYDFHVRNIAREGIVWGGRDGETIDFFKRYPRNLEENQNENTRSIAALLQYGAFRFYTGGDLCGVLLDDDGKDVDYEGRVGKVVGPVDLCKTNHHSSSDAMRPSFIQGVQARVYVTCCWWRGHLIDKTSSAMCDQSSYPGARLLCPTDPHPLNAEMLQGKAWRKYLVEKGGHVVVKAYDGGARYKVYFLTADDESAKVKLVFGPFESKGGDLGAI